MADNNLRVYPVDGDSYGEVIEYPQYAGYRFEPHEPGASGDRNHDLVVYAKPENPGDEETELGRHRSSDVLIVFPGQPSPVFADRDERSDRASSTTSTKAGTPAKSSTETKADNKK